MKQVLFLILFSIQLSAGIGVGYSGIGALPVELTSFTANLIGSNVELRWATATEINNNGFEVERLQDSKWEKIGFISGHGNSTSPNNYRFADTKPLREKVQYRLKQIDYNGNFKYTKSIEIGFGSLEFNLAQNYPNPFNPSTIISYSIPISSNVRVEVYNVLGKLMTTLVNENQEAGIYSAVFNAVGLGNGIYYCRISAGNFSETKKMLLLK